MRVETYLRQGRLLDQRINYHMKKLSELQSAAYSIPAPIIRRDRIQSSNTGEAPFVKVLMKVEEIQEQTKQEIEQMLNLKAQINEVIQQVDDPELQMVLVYRYLEGMSFEQIGNILKAGKSTVIRWHKKAINQITLPDSAVYLKFHL